MVQGGDRSNEIKRRRLEGVGQHVAFDVVDVSRAAISPGRSHARVVAGDPHDLRHDLAQRSRQGALAAANIERSAAAERDRVKNGLVVARVVVPTGRGLLKARGAQIHLGPSESPGNWGRSSRTG